MLAAPDLRQRPSQPRHRLDRLCDRVRGAEGASGSRRRLRAGAARCRQRADGLGPAPLRRQGSGADGARDAARARRDARGLPDRGPPPAPAGGRPDDGGGGPRPGARRRRRRTPDRRRDRAGACPPLHSRGAQVAHAARGADERVAAIVRFSTASRDRGRGRDGRRAGLGAFDRRSAQRQQDLRGGRRGGRQPRRCPAAVDRARRLAARDQQRDGGLEDEILELARERGVRSRARSTPT